MKQYLFILPVYRWLVLWSIVCLFLFPTALRADHYMFKQVSLQAGLPTTLSCIFSDSRGYVWTGTKSGLGRFDGNAQVRYLHQEEVEGSLPGNEIYQLFEDTTRLLWVLTDGGVAHYNRFSNDFTPLRKADGNPCVAYAICQWGDKVLLGGRNELLVYDGNAVNRLCEVMPQKLVDISRMVLLDEQTLLCSSRWEGVYMVNLLTGACCELPSLGGKEVTDMIVDSKQRIWVAVYNGGVSCYARNGEVLASYRTENSSLQSNLVISLSERKGKIWIGTDGAGIHILHPETNQFVYLKHVPGEPLYSLPTNSINCLYTDAYDNVWVGGVYNGLIGVREVSMKTHTVSIPDNEWGLSHNIVLSLFQESSQRIWIGTDGGGLSRFNPSDGRFFHYPSTRLDKITSICAFSSRELLVSAFAEGLFLFDTQTGRKQPFSLGDESVDQRISKHGYSVYLYRNTPHTILILSDHVYIYHLKERTLTVAKELPANYIKWGTLQSVASHGNRTFLFDSNRIYELNHDRETLRVLINCSPKLIINTVDYDYDGSFWIGTNQGMKRYHLQTNVLESIPTGLFRVVTSIVYDAMLNKLWIGADNHLFAYMPEDGRFVLYGESDGALPNEYIPRARLVDKQAGVVYMGGANGLLHIHPRKTDSISTRPELSLMRVAVNGEPVSDSEFRTKGVLEVPYNSNLRIQVISKEEDVFRRRLYRYRIYGLDSEYTESYSAEWGIRPLRSGTYPIHVSCTTREGTWLPDVELLQLVVLPPWYATWWFSTGCAFLILLILVLSFRGALKRKERKMKWLMKEHDHQVYEEKVRFLINISHELRTPLTLIYAPLKRMLNMMDASDGHYLALKAVYRQSQRMKALIDMVLDVRKLEVGEKKLKREVCSLNEWIKQVSQDFATEAQAEELGFSYQLDEAVGLVSLDKEKAEIVLSNLMMNALKHSPKGTTITLSSTYLEETDEVQVAVSDEGCGLKNVESDKLFTRFYQGEGEKYGTGIGLSYAKILVELHGGKMWASNNEQAGATFYFTLPVHNAVSEVTEAASEKTRNYLNELIPPQALEPQLSDSDDFDLSAYKILVADDNPDMTDFLKKALDGLFKQVIVASDGKEALKLTKNYLPDIVVSDVMMPKMNGYQFCKQLKEDASISHIPVILLTAREDEQSRQDGYRSQADDYLTKPFEVDTLLEMIRNRLKKRIDMRKQYSELGSLPLVQEHITQSDETFLFTLDKVVHENLSNKELDISFFCKHLGMSRASLYNKVKVLTGVSATEYVNKKRMEEAVRLIVETNLSLTEIAEKVGFASSSYFSTAFKQSMGETPSHYRKRMQDENA